MTIEQILENALGSTWLLPLLGLGGWLLKNYLRDKFVSLDDFNGYKASRGEEEKEYREYVKGELTENHDYIKVVDKKANENGKAVSELKGRLDK